MDKSILEKLINEKCSSRAIANRLNCSQSNVKYWLKKYDLKTLHRSCKNCTWDHLCTKCGEIDQSKFYKKPNGRAGGYCKKCYIVYWRIKARERRQRAVEYKGGKCELCGYSKCIASLDFHHKDPNEKDPNFKTARNWKWDRMKREVDKCMLLCKNCHGELHYKEETEGV